MSLVITLRIQLFGGLPPRILGGIIMDYFKQQFIEEKARSLTYQCGHIASQLTTMLGYFENERLFSPQFRSRSSEVTGLIRAFRDVHIKVRDTISKKPNFLEKFTEQELNAINNSNARSIKDIVVAWTNIAQLNDINEGLEHELTNIVRLEKLFFYDEQGYFVDINSFYSKLIG